MNWVALLFSVVVAALFVALIHSFYMFVFCSKLSVRLDQWWDGRRCICKKPKLHDVAERIRGENLFQYCRRCDAFKYNGTVPGVKQ